MKKPTPPAVPEPTMSVGLNRCPYCHEDVLVDRGGWLACARCLGRHHAACWSESNTCGACGHDACLQQAKRAEAPRPKTNPIVVGIALALFAVGGTIVALTDGPAGAPPPDAAPAEAVPVSLGADFSDALGTSGATVERVYVGAPAHTRGLQVGDVVQSINGEPIRSAASLAIELRGFEPGQTVTLGLLNPSEHVHRQPIAYQVELVAPVTESLSSESDSRSAVFHTLGLRVTTTASGDVLVQEALAGTLAAPKVAEGDVIESVNGRPVSNTRQLRRMLALARPGDRLQLGLRHPFGEGSIVAIALPPR